MWSWQHKTEASATCGTGWSWVLPTSQPLSISGPCPNWRSTLQSKYFHHRMKRISCYVSKQWPLFTQWWKYLLRNVLRQFGHGPALLHECHILLFIKNAEKSDWSQVRRSRLWVGVREGEAPWNKNKKILLKFPIPKIIGCGNTRDCSFQFFCFPNKCFPNYICQFHYGYEIVSSCNFFKSHGVPTLHSSVNWRGWRSWINVSFQRYIGAGSTLT